jgi:hypothetical protein
MPRIAVGSWMVRYPLGGNLSWTLQWLVGFDRLGCEVYLVEKSGYPNACFDPGRNSMSDDCSYGTTAVGNLLSRFGLGERWCFVDEGRRYFGMSRTSVEEVLRTADLFVDLGTHGAWLEEAAGAGARALVDGEPGFTQMKMELKAARGKPARAYDHYYSNGANIGTSRSTAPTAGREWRAVYNPIVLDLFPYDRNPPPAAPFTTVMNWRAHEPLVYQGRTYGQKDVEFAKFVRLPRLTSVPMEVAVAGGRARDRELEGNGWRVRAAHDVTVTYDSYLRYLGESSGEFSVCKHGYVATNSGWFSDRSAGYLASGRPVVMQETGFSDHLPCGAGLFAVRTAEEAAAAIDRVMSDYARHRQAARDVAAEHLDAARVLGKFLSEVGL